MKCLSSGALEGVDCWPDAHRAVNVKGGVAVEIAARHVRDFDTTSTEEVRARRPLADALREHIREGDAGRRFVVQAARNIGWREPSRGCE